MPDTGFQPTLGAFRVNPDPYAPGANTTGVPAWTVLTDPLGWYEAGLNRFVLPPGSYFFESSLSIGDTSAPGRGGESWFEFDDATFCVDQSWYPDVAVDAAVGGSAFAFRRLERTYTAQLKVYGVDATFAIANYTQIPGFGLTSVGLVITRWNQGA